MNVVVTQEGTPTVIAVSGNIDTNTAPEFQSFALGVVDGGANDVVVDMADCVYVSSAGLRAIVTLQKRLIDGSLTFKNVSQDIMDVFTMTGFDKILTFA